MFLVVFEEKWRWSYQVGAYRKMWGWRIWRNGCWRRATEEENSGSSGSEDEGENGGRCTVVVSGGGRERLIV